MFNIKKNKYQYLSFALLGISFFLNKNYLLEVNATNIISSLNNNETSQNYNTKFTSFNHNLNIDITEVETKNPIKIDGIKNLGINDTNDITYIYENPSLKSKKIAILPPKGICDIVDETSKTQLDQFLNKDNEYFIYIKSGDYEGYVLSKDISNTNLEDKLNFKTYAIVLDETSFYEEPNNKLNPLGTIEKNSIIEIKNYSKDNKYVKITYENNDVYIKTSVLKVIPCVDYAYAYEKGIYKKPNLDYSNREEFNENLIEFVTQFISNKYVWGGTSLINGTDCSGFTQSVYREFGYDINRVASDQYRNGVRISENELLPGDLVFYGKNGSISHVAMYIGNGEIIHASNSNPYPLGGIKISAYNYQTPIGYVRIVNF